LLFALSRDEQADRNCNRAENNLVFPLLERRKPPGQHEVVADNYRDRDGYCRSRATEQRSHDDQQHGEHDVHVFRRSGRRR